MRAFEAIGGVPIEILYDRMKTAVTGEDDEGHIVYNRSLIALAKHFGFLPRACRPYRAKTKGKVERPFSYIRQDFFLGRSFRNLDDLNGQLADWLDTVANVRLHGTTQRIVSEAFAAEKPDLQPLPATPFEALLKLERRVSHDGLVSIGGNYYSVPDRTRRIVEVHQLPDIIRILDGGRLVATHPVLEGRRQYRVDPAHRQGGAARALRHGDVGSVIIGRRGDHVARRSLAFYQAIAEHLAGGIGGPSGPPLPPHRPTASSAASSGSGCPAHSKCSIPPCGASSRARSTASAPSTRSSSRNSPCARTAASRQRS